MKVRGAYMAVQEFLYTYRQGIVYTEKGNNTQDSWHLDARRKIIIPDYQREYRWGEKQLSELVSDISSGNCYLGQIAVSRNSNNLSNYYLVDGQQRITSIIILLTVLCRQFYLHKDNINIKNYELHKIENNTDPELKDSVPIARLSFEANCFQNFQEFVAQIYELDTNAEGAFEPNDFTTPAIDFYRQKDRYISACSALNKIIIKNANSASLVSEQLRYIKELIRKILSTQISVVIFDGESSYESEKVFLDINEKGLRLDNEDILKAYYFQSISSETGKEALDTWTSLKKAYFKVSATLNSEKMPLETFVNYALQTDLIMQNPDFSYSRFDDELRYKGPDGKKHICQLFSDTRLHYAIQLVSNFLEDINSLLENDAHSVFYKNYVPGRDSTTREIFKMLFNSICRCEMKIVFIALIKMWWLKKNLEQNLSVEDIYQLFSFYIISNVSGLKKEKPLFSNDFISSRTVKNMYQSFHIIEAQMLKEAYSKATTLKRDQKKAEFLSFNIQMFYNDFHYNKSKKQWELAIKNSEFLAKYSSNRDKYAKDHFLIQNGKTIQLYNGDIFTVTQSMTQLRNRAYNFIYHKDTFDNVDFITRLELIFKDQPANSSRNPAYGEYENDYFHFIKEQLQFYFKTKDELPTWDTILQKYKEELPDVFPKIVSYILEEHCYSWNHHVCRHFQEQFPENLTA